MYRSLATFNPGGDVILFRKGRKVGFGKLMPSLEGKDSGIFRRTLHSHDLSKFEAPGQYLVVIWSVKIEENSRNLHYSYRYGGTEKPPSVLQDMEDGFHVWDLRELVPMTGKAEEADRGEEVMKQDITGCITGNSSRERTERALKSSHEVCGSEDDEEASPAAFGNESGDDLANKDWVDGSNKEKDTDVACSSSSGPIKDKSSIVRKRKYTYRNRRARGETMECSLSKRRRTMATGVSEGALGRITCCSRKKCFRNADHLFLKAQMERILTMSQSQRRDMLVRMLDSRSDTFQFNGKSVCATFLQKAFRFSRDLQSSVKGTALSRPLPCTISVPRQLPSEKRDAVICFLERLAESCANQMPDRQEQHLPYFNKDQVYSVFTEDYRKLYGTESTVPSQPYFYQTWREQCPQVKVRTVHRFAKCGTCERLRAMQEKARNDPRVLNELRDQKQRHNEVVACERREYQKKVDKAKLYPGDYCSFILDGADQSAFGLPHIPVHSKDARGHTIGVKLIGALEHGPIKHLTLFLMTEQYATGANHIVEALHRVLANRILRAPLPRTMFVQLDNCWRENKNRFFLAYLECLVAWGVFCEVYASFLPVGHTHSDIDQAFSCTSRRLRSTSAVTLEDMMKQLTLSYTPKPTVTHIKGVINFSDLCVQETCLESFAGFTEYHYFHFLRSADSVSEDRQDHLLTLHSTTCMVRVSCKDPWKPISDRGKGFLKRVPDLSKTPPTVVRSPTNLPEINKRLESEEVRISSHVKMTALRALRDEVYRSGQERFHWDLRSCVENNGAYRCSSTESESEGDEIMADAQPLVEAEYSVNDFIAVRHKRSHVTAAQTVKRVPFWIGKVLELEKNSNGVCTKLKIHWFELKAGRSAITGKYKPSTIPKSTSDSTRVPWIDEVPVDSILHRFGSFTTSMFLRTADRKAIREALNLLIQG